MITTPFKDLPEEARLYVFAASRSLPAQEETALLERVDRFLIEWQSHKEPVSAAREWRHNRFLFIGIDEAATSLSGCSIDSMTRILKEIETSLGVTMIDGSAIYYRTSSGIARASREEFRSLVASGDVTSDTIVFDLTVAKVGDLKAGAFELPFRDSWHSRAFKPAGSPRKAGIDEPVR